MLAARCLGRRQILWILGIFLALDLVLFFIFFEQVADQVFHRVTAPTSRVKLPTETIYENGEVQIREVFHLRDHFKQDDLFDYGLFPQWNPDPARNKIVSAYEEIMRMQV